MNIVVLAASFNESDACITTADIRVVGMYA